jgi:hypothetical protein
MLPRRPLTLPLQPLKSLERFGFQLGKAALGRLFLWAKLAGDTLPQSPSRWAAQRSRQEHNNE